MPNKTEFPPLLRDDERACCDSADESPQDPKPHGCVDSWEDELRVADNAYKQALGEAGKAQNEYDNASLWESTLKEWVDDADEADKKAHTIELQLGLFQADVERREKNSTRTAEGVEILLCLVKRVFDSVQDIVRQNVTPELPKKRLLYDLTRYIQCKPELDEKEKQEALACITPYEKAITAVSAAQDELLKKLLQMLAQADKLATALGIPPAENAVPVIKCGHVSGKDTKDLGLLWQIRDLLKRIKGDSTVMEKIVKCGCSHNDNPPPESDEAKSPCGEGVLIPAEPLLPIKKECAEEKTPGATQSYYCELHRLRAEVSGELGGLLDKLDKALKKRDETLARRNSLEAAKKAADEAKAAK